MPKINNSSSTNSTTPRVGQHDKRDSLHEDEALNKQSVRREISEGAEGLYYKSMESLSNFESEVSLYDRLWGRGVDVMRAEGGSFFTAWVVQANEAGAIISDGEGTVFYPWHSIGLLRFRPEIDIRAKTHQLLMEKIQEAAKA